MKTNAGKGSQIEILQAQIDEMDKRIRHLEKLFSCRDEVTDRVELKVQAIANASIRAFTDKCGLDLTKYQEMEDAGYGKTPYYPRKNKKV